MRAGFGRAVITPDVPVFLAGYGDRRDPANAVHDELEVRVLVVEADDIRAALVTFDLLVMSRDFADPIRAAVADVIDTTPAAVLTSCTHVHAGPSALTGTDAIGWPVPDRLRDRLVASAADAARSASAALAPCALRFVRTPLPDDVAVNRRGHPLHTSAAVAVFDPVAIIANLGIHPTITGPSNLAIATDWVGPFRHAIETQTDMPACFLQGCQGDVNPAVTAWDDGAPASWSPVVDAFAARLASTVTDALDHTVAVTGSPIAIHTRTIRVPLGDTLLTQLAGGARDRAIELVNWTFGDLDVVGVPGEGFHGVEDAIRATHPDPLLIAGLAPDWHGYLARPYTDGYEEGLSLGPDAVAEIVDALTG
jgi:hypothetical protein